MLSFLLAFLLPVLSGQTNTDILKGTPIQQSLVLEIGPQQINAIPSQEVNLGTEKVYTIAVNDYFYEPHGGQLVISDVAPLQGSSLEDYPWLDFCKSDSALLMKPIKKEDKGDYHLRVVASNSIGQYASQLMTIHVVEAKGSNITSASECSSGYNSIVFWVPVAIAMAEFIYILHREIKLAPEKNIYKKGFGKKLFVSPLPHKVTSKPALRYSKSEIITKKDHWKVK